MKSTPWVATLFLYYDPTLYKVQIWQTPVKIRRYLYREIETILSIISLGEGYKWVQFVNFSGMNIDFLEKNMY